MSELPPEEPPASVTVSSAPTPAAPVAEETALAAGAALSESGQARAEAEEAQAAADAALSEADSARAVAAAAAGNAEESAAAAQTVEQRLEAMAAMMQPVFDDYAARRLAEQQAASAEPEVSEVDATGTSGTESSGGSGATPDSGPDSSGSSPVRRGLRRGRRTS